MSKQQKIYEKITQQIIEALESGTIPWRRPWVAGVARNIRGNEYRGINAIILGMASYKSPFWMTYKQARKLGGHVKQGESGTTVVFWNWFEKETGEVDKNGETETRKIPFLRYYNVFNVEQCEELDESKLPVAPEEIREHTPIEEAEIIVDGMPARPEIENNSAKAYYRPSSDTVSVPAPEQFKDAEGYYSVLFHELVHSTGHKKRLDRDEVMDSSFFGSHNYSKEELVAEFGSAFLCGTAGISPQVIENQSAYIKSWLRALKDNNRMVLHAAARAQKASDFILNKRKKR